MTIVFSVRPSFFSHIWLSWQLAHVSFDKPINIKDRNFPGLSQLSEQFGFQALSKKLSAHRRLPSLSAAQTAEFLSRISALEERVGQHERQLAALQSALFPALLRFEADLAAVAAPPGWIR
jgi:hypothetical protein